MFTVINKEAVNNASRTFPVVLNSLRSLVSAKLTGETINENVLRASYAVRGPVLDRAMQLQKELDEGKKLPFDDIVACNIGNPQALKQKPITFSRQVLSLLVNPELMDDPNAKKAFPQDVIERAKKYMSSNIGAYSNSQGIDQVRMEVAKFINERDGLEEGTAKAVNPANIFLTNGASDAVTKLFQLMIRTNPSAKDGVLVPIPQYPLYSALCAISDGVMVPYGLTEEKGWSTDVAEIKKALASAKEAGVCVRGLVVINPGNPTGNTLRREDMVELIEICAKENLVLMGDEVYQENIWKADRPFVSFRKVATELGYDDSNKNLQLISMHSISKGFLGECGFRGGYMEMMGFDEGVRAELYKLFSISLCSNTSGQIMTGLMCNPPAQGTESYQLYQEEKMGILASLKKRADMVTEVMNSLTGVSCQIAEGALYAFPQITLPEDFCREAESKNLAPDLHYCLKLLEATGIVVVPGSGFGQKEGTWHFRTTILPPETTMGQTLERLRAFHEQLMTDYNYQKQPDAVAA